MPRGLTWAGCCFLHLSGVSISRALASRALSGLLLAAVVFAGLELVLRGGLGPPPPSVRVFRALGEHETYLAFQSTGWVPIYQDDLTPLPVDDGRPLMAFLGGSTVHRGTPQLRRGGEFPGIVGRRLRIRSANLGNPGLDSHDLVEILRELLAKGPENPDVAVVYTGHNDFGNARYQQRYGTVAKGVALRVQVTLERLQVYSQLSRLLRPARGVARQRGQSEDAGPLPEDAWRAAGRDLERNLRRMVDLAQGASVPLFFVTPISSVLMPPADPRCDDGVCLQERYLAAREAGDGEGLRQVRDLDRVSLRAPSSVRTFLLDLADAHPGVWVVDAETGMPQDPVFGVPATQSFVDAIHLSPSGHRDLGTLIADDLKQAIPEVIGAGQQRGRAATGE